jgi:glucokinase
VRHFWQLPCGGVLKEVPFWIGFDLGGTKMMACVLDKNYHVLGRPQIDQRLRWPAAKGRKKIVKAIHEAIAKPGVNPKGIKGIGIGCPGLVNPEKGILIFAPNLGWNEHGHLRNLLQTAVFKKPVAVLNDVDAGTYGEYVLGAGKGSRSLLGVFPGTGVGAGFVYDGKLVMGRASRRWSWAMIFPRHASSAVPHGSVLLEDLTSRLALASQAGLACYRGQLPDLDKKTEGAAQHPQQGAGECLPQRR